MKFNRTTTKFAAAALTLAACGTASAAVYRAGLAGGFINSYDANKYTSVAIDDLSDAFMGPIAATAKVSSNGSKTYPPVWADNRTWRFHGQMYFDGSTYYFAESIDDVAYLAIDGQQELKDATWNNVGMSGALTPAAGWHDVEIRFGNAGGGAGVPYDTTKDANGKLCGFGYVKNPASKPTDMSGYVYPEDPGDGSLFRVAIAETYADYLTSGSTEEGYSVTVRSLAPRAVVMTGSLASADGETVVSSEPVTVDPNGTAVFSLPWTGEDVPSFTVSLVSVEEEESSEVSFWETTEPYNLANSLTSSVSVTAPAQVYENETREQVLVVSRLEADAWQAITVNIAYEGNADDFTGLPSSVTLAVGEARKEVAFKTVDNGVSDGNRNLVVSIAEGGHYVAVEPTSATIQVLDDEAGASICTWTGDAGDASWENALNWDVRRVPAFIDTARFTDAGIAANETILVGAPERIAKLVIETTTAFTLAAVSDSGATLELGGITRLDVEGTEGDQKISVPLKIYPLEDSGCVCFVAGSGALRLDMQAQRAVDGTKFVKTGEGLLYLMKQDTVPNGSLKVLAGVVKPTVDKAACGTVEIGGGDETAQYIDERAYAHSMSPHVYTNGTFRSSGSLNSGGADNFEVHEGGYARYDSSYSCKYDLWGATLEFGRGWSGGYTQHITAHKSDLIARLNGDQDASGYYGFNITVEDGPNPIDFVFGVGGIEGGRADQTLSVSGAGAMQTLAGWGTSHKVSVSGTTWLMDCNPTTSAGSGSNNLTVGNSATLGGLGRFGGINDEQTLTVNGSSGKVATLAPGSITEAGEPVYGTYTVGTETHPSTLTMGQYSKMKVRFASVQEAGKRLDKNDCLMVNGALSIASGSTLEIVADPANMRNIRGGTYVIATVTGEVTGDFATVVRPEGAKWKVAWRTRQLAAAEGEAPVTVKDLTVSIAGGLSIRIR